MKTTKTLTIRTTVAELNSSLEAYQADMMLEMVSKYRKDNSQNVNWRDAAKFGLICMKGDERFDQLVEETGTPWIATPENVAGWVQSVCDFPYMYGITDEVASGDIEEVVLFLDGTRYEINDVLKSI